MAVDTEQVWRSGMDGVHDGISLFTTLEWNLICTAGC